MQSDELDIVTGAFGYSGKYIARRLLAMGRGVRTLTHHPGRADPINRAVEVAPLCFDRPAELAESMRGAATLYNTYWVRFPRGEVTYERAVENTQILFTAARAAGIRRIVHTSITNPSLDSPLGYFEGKAKIEEFLKGLGVSYAILRPTVLFGHEDVLINNLAWVLRHLPAMAMPRAGDYRLQPVYVDDFAELAVECGLRDGNLTLDAVGPEVYSFKELVKLLAGLVGSRARLIEVPPSVALFLSRLVGLAVRDVLLTRDELAGLTAGLLVSKNPPTCATRLSQWSDRHADLLGREYASELNRHFRRPPKFSK
jgi:NADH dehydrogenase